MAKYAFNHDNNNGEIIKAMGVSDEQFSKIIRAICHAEIYGKNTLQVFEIALNKLDPQNIVEAAIIGYSIAKCAEIDNNQMLQFLRMMRAKMNDE